FYRSEHQKRKDEICPFSSLAFLQPTTVDKEPFFCVGIHDIIIKSISRKREKRCIIRLKKKKSL
ncbi:hypothetical protein, partial [Streptococcus pneumoniae]|uniref:hypothetical protein n=1 Tax=Streptococcus pneumoniae TaxID=1313 RepID=UPI001D01E01F